VVQLVVQAKVTKWRKLQMSVTCVQTTIQHPIDGGLLVGSVGVPSRIVQRAKPILDQTRPKVIEQCCSRLRSSSRRAKHAKREFLSGKTSEFDFPDDPL